MSTSGDSTEPKEQRVKGLNLVVVGDLVFIAAFYVNKKFTIPVFGLLGPDCDVLGKDRRIGDKAYDVKLFNFHKGNIFLKHSVYISIQTYEYVAVNKPRLCEKDEVDAPLIWFLSENPMYKVYNHRTRLEEDKSFKADQKVLLGRVVSKVEQSELVESLKELKEAFVAGSDRQVAATKELESNLIASAEQNTRTLTAALFENTAALLTGSLAIMSNWRPGMVLSRVADAATTAIIGDDIPPQQIENNDP